MCDEGWIGQQCQTAICEPPCTDHGNCTSPGTCTCDVGWHGLTCEMPFSPGFQPEQSYIYNITLSYVMETEIATKTNASEEINSSTFLSNVNITFSVSSILRKTDSFIALLKILDVNCESDVKNQTDTLTCDENSTKSLLQIKLLFSQDLTTGKIKHVYYNSSSEFEAVFVSRILRFIDCEILPWSERSETFSTVNGQEINDIRTPSKSSFGLQCFNFNRTIRSDNMSTNREEKRVCMGRAGVPENVSMTEVFIIGQDMKLGNHSDVGDKNVSLLPSVKGRVAAFGSLTSVKRMANSDVNEQFSYAQATLADTAGEIRSSSIDELAIKELKSQGEYQESNVLKDLNAILNHPVPHRRLPLGLDLAQKSKSAIPVIKKLVFSDHKMDRESRSLLISILGASNTMTGQKSLMEILDKEEMVENDHFIALGSVAQISNASEDMVSVVKKIMDTTMNEDLKTRSCLVLGVLGSKGLQHKVVPILAEQLFKEDVTHNEKCALISALGNTHSESAVKALSKLIMGNETFYKVLAIRALRNIPGQESHNIVLERLSSTRNKKEAIQCVKTLEYKKAWVTQNDLRQILSVARESKDIDFLNVVKNMFTKLDLCKIEQNIDYHEEIDKLLEEYEYSSMRYYSLARQTQNFGVYFQLETDSQPRGSEYGFDATTNLYMKVFGKYMKFFKAGTANSFVDKNDFSSVAYMTLILFGYEYDLFSRSWQLSTIPTNFGNPCHANHGNIRYTPGEYFSFNKFKILNGLFGFSFVSLTFDAGARVSFGRGYSVVGNNFYRWPQQINIAVKPQIAAVVRVGIKLSVVVASAEVQGEIDAVTGGIRANLALNVPQKSFCHYISAEVTFLSGSVKLYLKLGFWIFSRKYEIEIFEWSGFKDDRKLHESFCCQSAFLTHEKDLITSSNAMVTQLNNTKRISDTLVLLNTTNKCFHSTSSDCPVELIQNLIQKGIYVFNFSMSQNLKEDNNLFFQRRVFPILITGFGNWFGLNEMGDVVELNEIGQLTRVQASVGNLLADLAYKQEHTNLRRPSNTHGCAQYHHPSAFNIQERTRVLDFRPFCSKMQAVCENIKMGQKYHSDVMVFTENPGLIKVNNREACSSYIRANGIRYPYYCEAYPFSFSLQGGKGATVIKANVMENNVKMAAVHAFIKEFNVKGGDAFVVVV